MTQRSTRAWVPMQRAERVIPPKTQLLAAANPVIAAHLAKSSEMWANDRYTVTVYRRDDSSVECLSVKRNDKGAVRDWRHMQKIKNELAGPETEAFQLFPAESRLVDTANQTWIWVLPPDLRIPLGFGERAVGGPDEAEAVGATQREFEPGLLEES
jgi:hypothetical protein